MTTVAFYAQFVGTKVGVDALTPTWDIERITRSDGTRAALVTGGATSIAIGRRGLYGYLLTSADLSLYDYVATAITSSTDVDQKEVPALWTRWTEDANQTGIRSAVGMAAADLDTQIAALPTAAEVWTNSTRTLTQSAAAVTAAVSGSSLAVTRYVDFSATLSGLTISALWTKIYVTCKGQDGDPEDASSEWQLMVTNPADSVNDGVQYVSGSAASAGQRPMGSLTVDQSSGTIAIAMTDNLTGSFTDGSFVYDVIQFTSTAKTQLADSAICTVSRTETRATT
jgi:hypothetical protein